jgi:hypothetical protein
MVYKYKDNYNIYNDIDKVEKNNFYIKTMSIYQVLKYSVKKFIN